MKKTIALALLTVAFAAPAFAAPGDNPRRRVDYYDNAGTLQEMDNFGNSAKFAELIAHATPLKPGTIVVTANGQMFILQDFRMADGKMASDSLMH